MSQVYQAMLHVYRKQERIVVYLMDLHGNHKIYQPGGAPPTETWPHFAAARPYLDAWFAAHTGTFITTRKQHTSQPGDLDYPRALADLFSQDPHLGMWAYATSYQILVSLHQIALAMGQTSSKALRENLESQGLRFITNTSGDHLTSLGAAQRTLGANFAGRLLLYPRQAAAFLGTTSHATPVVLKRLGIALERDSRTLVEWRDLQRVERISRQRFRLKPLKD